MPVSPHGQLITFSIANIDEHLRHWVWYEVKVGDTVRTIAARLGFQSDERRIADENNIRYVRQTLRWKKPTKKQKKLQKTKIRVPGGGPTAVTGSFNVLAGDSAPVVAGGYAKLSVMDRPKRIGLTTFDGYDPITLSIPVRFEEFTSGNSASVERRIAILERMAGRGTIAGNAAPPVVRVTVTGPRGGIVPLIPYAYQSSTQNPSAPLYRVAGVDWDSEPIRDTSGKRLRQLATITLQENTMVKFATRS
ncbi:hypothetical protein UFOVP1313_15 [uncultured Caudovirales phage]|uniref:LysM domain-containing protein n=1 Tax=uncultured Caudovirales phage TaxID=2100421 RepID=A0A6J5RTI7_9CAUD|nr:hypothetical protein UFOVP1313_15 [uncultured Caudovirales phage]